MVLRNLRASSRMTGQRQARQTVLTSYVKAFARRGTSVAFPTTPTRYNLNITPAASPTCTTHLSRPKCIATCSPTASGNQKAPPAAARGNFLLSETAQNDHWMNRNLLHYGTESSGRTCSSAEPVQKSNRPNLPKPRRRQRTPRKLRNYMLYSTE